MITTHPSSDTQKKLRALEAQVVDLKRRYDQSRALVVAARELLAAEQEVENMVCHFKPEWVSLEARLRMVDRLNQAHKAMRQLMKFKPVEEPEEEP